MIADVYKSPLEAFPLLCFRQIIEFARFLDRQNQSVSNAFYAYAPYPPSALKGFQREKDNAKLTIFLNIAKEETKIF